MHMLLLKLFEKLSHIFCETSFINQLFEYVIIYCSKAGTSSGANSSLHKNYLYISKDIRKEARIYGNNVKCPFVQQTVFGLIDCIRIISQPLKNHFY